MIKTSINPNKELFKWGPLDGHLIYVDFFCIGFLKYQSYFYSWPDLIGYFNKEKTVFILDYPDLRDSGEVNFKKYILSDKNFDRYYKEWDVVLKDLSDLHKKLDREHISQLKDKELRSKFKKWSELYLKFWTIGLLPELSNWGGEQMLKKELEKKVKANDFVMLFERLSAPEKLSFYQQADLDLFGLKKYQSSKNFQELLSDYQSKYFHILNSYHHTRVLSKRYFEKELNQYTLKQAQAKTQELKLLPQKVKQEKRRLVKKYNLGQNIAKIADRLAFCIWWQDLRKFYIFRANHIIDLFLKEFSKRYKVDFKDLHYYNYHEILSLINDNKKITQTELNKRYSHLLFVYSEKTNTIKYFSGQPVQKFIKPYLDIKADEDINEIKGLVVGRGKKVKGRVKILNSPKEISKMKQGDILVSPMTSPDYITAIKKASAIITDEGGMTCHAAIVSRELNIPCIVATKLATKVLNDNDIVEVNTDSGIVKIIR